MASIETAQPFAFSFDAKSTALIVIDMQRDFIEPGGFGATLGNDVSLLQAIVPTTAMLIKSCRDYGLPVIHTRECHKADLSDLTAAKRDRGAPTLRIGDNGPMGRILIAGEPGADIIPELYPAQGELVIDKPGKGAFYRTALSEQLDHLRIESLILAGVTTEVCVQTTMREANDRGYNCLLIEDATESYFPAFKAATLDMVRAQGALLGWTATCAELKAALDD